MYSYVPRCPTVGNGSLVVLVSCVMDVIWAMSKVTRVASSYMYQLGTCRG